MITAEQEREISLYLLGKNLPMDLMLELKDHMMEQIENKKDIDFETAFKEVKVIWKEELALKLDFWSFSFRTKLHQQALNIAFKPKVWLSFKFLLSYILIYNVLLGTDEQWAYMFIYFIHLCLYIGVIILYIFNFKLLNTTTYNYEKKISYLQRGSAILFVSCYQLMIVILFSFDLHFNNLKNFVYELRELNLPQIPYFSLFSLHVWAFLNIMGYLYFVDYKKTVSVLQKRINLKL